MNFTADITLGDYDVTVSFDVSGSAYVPATSWQPEEGGIDSFDDIYVTECVDEFDDGEHGCTIVGLDVSEDNLSFTHNNVMIEAIEAYDPY